MGFKQIAGTAIVPTMSRLVLALAFTTVGYNKMATESEFSASDAEVLKSLGVPVRPIDAEAGVARLTSPTFVAASFRQDGGSADPPTLEPPATEETSEEPPPTDETTDEAPDETTDDATNETADETSGLRVPADDAETPPASEPDDARFTAKTMHKITLLCHGAGWPQPRYLALVAALTELVGGILLLVGFLTRIWALGLSIAMGVAVYLVSMGMNHVHEMSPFVFATEIGRFNTLFSQLGLFVLAFGLLLTGPGPLSIDRFLFGGGRRGGGSGDGGGIEIDDDASLTSGGRPV